MRVSTYLNGPLIARLFGHKRLWAWRKLRRRAFGPIMVSDGVVFASLAGVEQYADRQFSIEQIEAAAEGQLGRIVTLPDPEQEVA